MTSLFITLHSYTLYTVYISTLYLYTLCKANAGPSIAHGESENDIDEQPAKMLATLCSPGVCRNGQCYIRGKDRLCYCQSLFWGSRCEYVKMDQVTYTVISSTVIFQWPRPPRLRGYSFVYYELDDPSSFLYRRDIYMKDSERAALVGNLKGGYTTYRVCIEDQMLADRVVRQQNMDYLSNCINLTTQPDLHTLTAWCIAALLVCVAILLIYWQKDKFELLYFSKPAYVTYEQMQNDLKSAQEAEEDDDT